ncbi:BlaI/MecI/CopY family transcriptional regulator [Aestuariibacter halophilus]|uniref:BlaI/MecI/CopY family transcriptional regulator n=1 Tax=Fluctibacter halophilus TaxID=226011 RepID=A0ABS8GCI1_9ALTE|nr:BlaI/MecI/CopY family transcriptional regulator [Aestuariibacter halophilus]MCC2616906.1 BlaI/MecI/CopY family transcriptional regulator [Aestuariibacter halophilus]
MEISDAEYDVMCAIWAGHPVDAKTIIARLSAHKDWHDKTVKTLLGRLVKKGALTFQKDARAYLYSPSLAKEAYQRQQSQHIIERFFGGRLSPFVTAFAKQKSLQAQDVEALKTLIENWERDND